MFLLAVLFVCESLVPFTRLAIKLDAVTHHRFLHSLLWITVSFHIPSLVFLRNGTPCVECVIPLSATVVHGDEMSAVQIGIEGSLLHNRVCSHAEFLTCNAQHFIVIFHPVKALKAHSHYFNFTLQLHEGRDTQVLFLTSNFTINKNTRAAIIAVIH